MPPTTPRQELAAAAYAHACAVLGPSDAATEAAVLAVRRGGRSLATVLGHARDVALAREADAAGVDPDAPAPTDLDELAGNLAFLRPVAERAVVDLDSRYGLDQAALGRALGTTPAAAAALAAEVAAEWQRTLDPVLLARLGPGSCPQLAEVLGTAAEPPDEPDAPEAPAQASLGDLVAAGERAGAHVEQCDICRDRLRAMVSVRTLLAQRPLGDPPHAVVEAAAVARLRAAAMPPPLERVRRAARGRLPVVAAAAAVAVVAVLGGAVLTGDDDEQPASELEAMTQVPAASNALAVRPAVIDAAATGTVRLRNLRDTKTRWTATADRPWVVVEPSSGDLDGGAAGSVVIALGPDAPEGEVTAAVTFTGGDGSTAVARVRSNVSRAPDIAAERTACVVTASVEDDSELTSVVLHQRNGTSSPMRQGDAEGSWTRALDPAAGPWWVTATDALGNEGRTPEQPLADGC